MIRFTAVPLSPIFVEHTCRYQALSVVEECALLEFLLICTSSLGASWLLCLVERPVHSSRFGLWTCYLHAKQQQQETVAVVLCSLAAA